MKKEDFTSIQELRRQIGEIISEIDNRYVLEFFLSFIKSSWDSWK